MEITVRPIVASQVRELSRVLGLAFDDDPMVRWCIPADRGRPRRAALMFEALIRHLYLPHGAVDAAFDEAGRIVGGAVWSPPGTWDSGSAQTLRMLPSLARAFRLRLAAAGMMSERMAKAHPHEPHWYLAIVGTDPAVRGKGYAHALLTPRLAHCDEIGSPAYLESSKFGNIAYYERFGFEQRGELDATAGGPLLWPMWRQSVTS
ncbi:putative acetyltransferase [Nocardia nova SH22a]|uniref:Putative acetyltransferase n=1 Tax=Nocardia nova SH22a TaxID=1415166 RepID=W5TA31_9NOCA|nr:GNAT family N-acetyltransferase [Nocardia nova]AHH16200.1 putative acetyltransferase [Nocardia nova SH22a]